jgi:hypothetical protein
MKPNLEMAHGALRASCEDACELIALSKLKEHRMSSLILAVEATAAITTLILLSICLVGAWRCELEGPRRNSSRRREPVSRRLPRLIGIDANGFAATRSRCSSCGQMLATRAVQQLSG